MNALEIIRELEKEIGLPEELPELDPAGITENTTPEYVLGGGGRAKILLASF